MDEASDCKLGVLLEQRLLSATNISSLSHIVVQGFQQARTRTKLVVDRDAGDARGASDRVQAKVRIPTAGKGSAGGFEDASTRFSTGQAPFVHAVRAPTNNG